MGWMLALYSTLLSSVKIATSFNYIKAFIRKEVIISQHFLVNKTKYFRLRLTDDVSSERPKRDLRLT